jgi:3-phenylpropionate/trans-cinnamate dioxygenase ferredoxin reductase subunit
VDRYGDSTQKPRVHKAEVMDEISSWDYVIVGTGPAAAEAAVAIRELDNRGKLLMLGAERQLPYQRPPLSKGLWTGKDTVEELPLRSAAEWDGLSVQIHLGDAVIELDAGARTLTSASGRIYRYERLLLATGGRARQPELAIATLRDRVFTLRNFQDYERLQAAARPGLTVLVVGGGFLGAELAAALSRQEGLKVHHAFAGNAPLAHVLPPTLQKVVLARYGKAGVQLHPQHRLEGLDWEDGSVRAHFTTQAPIACDLLVYALGMESNLELAQQAGLTLDKGGVLVNTELRSSDSRIWAAGDLATYPDPVWQEPCRLEHWDNAEATGRAAGRAMAGRSEPFRHQSLFFSDLFELGFEAVGRCDSQRVLRVAAPPGGGKAVVYYGDGDWVEGVLLWNVWGKADAAREGIAAHRPLMDLHWVETLET